MPRRVSLPGADELFRTTGGMALQSSTPRQHSGAETAPQATERLRQVPTPAGEPDTDAGAGEPAGEPAAPAAEVDPGDQGTRDTVNGVERPQPPRAAHEPPPAAEHTRTAGPDSQAAVAPAQRRPPQEHTGQQRRRERERRVAPNRRPSGRERHDEKITVYVSAEELMDLEHARLVLRGEHGLAVDRGRIVREAVAVVLADLESRGDASILVRRLRGR